MSSFNPARARALRERRKLTREQVAVQIGKSYAVLTKIERGECRPSLGTLGALTNVYDCRVGEFFDGDGEPDLLGDSDPRPTELGPDMDEWIRTVKALMASLTPEVARRVSAVLLASSTNSAAS